MEIMLRNLQHQHQQPRSSSKNDPPASAFEVFAGSTSPSAKEALKWGGAQKQHLNNTASTTSTTSTLQSARKIYTAPILTKKPKQPVPQPKSQNIPSNQPTATPKPKIRITRESEQIYTQEEAKEAEEMVSNQLPKSRMFVQKLGSNGMTALHMKLETAFGMMVRRAETLGSAISIREYHFLLYRFISEHVASTISFLESCSFDSVELKEMNSCRSHFQGLVEAVRKKDYETTEKHDMFNNMTLWIRSIVGFFAMLQRREIEIGRMIKDFQVLEEESIIFRDVLRQLEVQNSSGKPKPIEVTIRQITISDKSGYLKSQASCDQSTMTESESTSTEFEQDGVVCNEEKAPIIKYETLFVPIMAPQHQTISRNPSISPKPNRKLSFISGDVTQEYRQPHIPVLVTQDTPSDALKRLSIAKRQSVSTKPANSSVVSLQEPTTITKSASVSAVSDSFPSTTNIYVESASTMSLATLHPTLSTTLTDTQTSTTNLNSTSQDLNSTSKHPSTTVLHSQNSLSAATSQNMLSASPSHGNISTIASGVSTATSTKQGSMASLAPKESKTVICGTDIPIPKSTDSTTQTLDIENPLQKTVNQYKKQVSDLQAALRTSEAKELETAAEVSVLKETHAKHVLDVEKKFEGVIEVERCRVAEVLGRALELESKVAQLTNEKSNEAEILAMRDAEIVELKEEIEGLKRQVQELDKEKAQMESDLEVANMDVFTLQSEVATLKETLDAKQREFQTALEEKERELQACRTENQEMIESLKLEASKAVAEAADVKGLMMQSKNRAGELHHQLVMLQERSSQIEDLYNALLVSCKANEYKVKELDAMVDTIMRYPDVSLGQPLEDPGDGQYDELFKEMINSNNMRISLLEQKNNEYRYIRMKNADGDDSKYREYLSKRNSVPVKLFSGDRHLDRHTSMSVPRVGSSNSSPSIVIPGTRTSSKHSNSNIQRTSQSQIHDEVDLVSTIVHSSTKQLYHHNQHSSSRDLKSPMPLGVAADIILNGTGIGTATTTYTHTELRKLSNPSVHQNQILQQHKKEKEKAKQYQAHLYRHHEKLPGNNEPTKPQSPAGTLQQKALVLEPKEKVTAQFERNPEERKRGMSHSHEVQNYKQLRNPNEVERKKEGVVVVPSGGRIKTHFPVDEHKDFKVMEDRAVE